MNIIFTEHAKHRIKKRHISVEEVIDAIINPESTRKRYGKYYAVKSIGLARIEVVYEKDKYIKVITVYYE